MAFTKKAAPAVQPDPDAPNADAVKDLPVTQTAPPAPPAEVFEAYSGPAAIGTQFLQLISKTADGTKIEALQIGQRGVIVVIGFTSVFIPGADIVDRGNGKQIV